MVLAAGPSTRFGADPPKQLVDFDGEPLVRRLARRTLAAALDEVIVVVGFAAERVRAVIADLPVRIVDSPDYRDGQSASVRAGLAAIVAAAPGAEAAIFIAVDQPLLTSDLLDSLVDSFRDSGRSIVVPTFDGRRGSPVLIARELFAALAQITGDVGGRQLFGGREEEILEVAQETERPLLDVDTWEAYRRLRQLGE